MQMAESRRGCTPAQQRMHNSNLLACTSRLSAIVAELLISRAFSSTNSFSWYKSSISAGFPRISGNIIEIPGKGWDAPDFY